MKSGHRDKNPGVPAGNGCGMAGGDRVRGLQPGNPAEDKGKDKYGEFTGNKTYAEGV